MHPNSPGVDVYEYDHTAQDQTLQVVNINCPHLNLLYLLTKQFHTLSADNYGRPM